jgi:hypothetical protein
MHPIFEGAELLGADRAAGVHAAGGDADLGAEAEFAAVGELGRGVVQHDRRVDLGEELLRRGAVFGDDIASTLTIRADDTRPACSTTRWA